jgi:hypothetical protein
MLTLFDIFNFHYSKIEVSFLNCVYVELDPVFNSVTLMSPNMRVITLGLFLVDEVVGHN